MNAETNHNNTETPQIIGGIVLEREDKNTAALPPEIPYESPKPVDFPWRKMLRFVLAGNPFYIISAGLMLYGVYLVSADANLVGREMLQLVFNFSALQVYELLLSVTAVFLARRFIWYESTQLVLLESMFVFIPFILLVQASFLNNQITTVLAAVAASLGAGRFWGIKKRVPEYPFPSLLVVMGALLLGLNLFFPIYYRQSIETTEVIWTGVSKQCWMFLLPCLILIGGFIPGIKRQTENGPSRQWLPFVVGGLWIAVTGVHLASIDYVNSQPFRIWVVTPSLWMLSWVVNMRVQRRHKESRPIWIEFVHLAPFLTSVAGLSYTGMELMQMFVILNAVIYGVVWLRDRDTFAGHLSVASVIIALIVIPTPLFQWMPHLTRGGSASVIIGLYLLLQMTLSRNVVCGLMGAIIGGYLADLLSAGVQNGIHFAAQFSMVYVMLHSIRWQTKDNSLSFDPLRITLALMWMIHSIYWESVAKGIDSLYPASFALLVLGIWMFARHRLPTVSSVIGLAATAVILTSPATYLVALVLKAPVSLLVVGGSFVVFAAGTVVAVLKRRWMGRLENGDCP